MATDDKPDDFWKTPVGILVIIFLVIFGLGVLTALASKFGKNKVSNSNASRYLYGGNLNPIKLE